jgi:hypothetical protein
MTDPLDVDLKDAELSDEIALVSELMVAAAESPTRLTQAQVDAILSQYAPV